MAWLRWVIGEELTHLLTAQRAAWCDVINAYQQPEDGAYRRVSHSAEHANASAVIALCLLGGRHHCPGAP